MLEMSEHYHDAITGAARRMHIRVPIRVTAPGLVIGTLTPSAGDLSDSDGMFQAPQVVSQEISGAMVLQNLVLTFPDDGFPVDLTVAIISSGSVVFTKDISGNTDPRVEVSGFTVYYPDEITLTSDHWSAAGKAMTVEDILPGYEDTWTEDDLTELTVQMQADFSALSLPSGTAQLTLDNTDKRFDPTNKSGLFLSIEEGQPVPVELGVDIGGSIEYVPLGTFFQHDNGWRQDDANMTIKWTLVDICGLLAAQPFTAPDTLPTTMGEWVALLLSQLGAEFSTRLIIDPVVAGMTMEAVAEDVDGKNCGDILCWLCQAAGVFPRADAQTGHLRLATVGSTGNIYELDNLSARPSHAVNDRVGNVTVTLPDDTKIILGGNSSFVAQTASLDSPFIADRDRAIMAVQNLLAAYGGMKVSAVGRGDPSSEIGDKVSLQIGKNEYIQGWIKSQTFEFSGGVMQNCKTELLQSDGFSFAFSATLTGSGVWFSPRGASQLRVVLVGGGDYGATNDGGAGGKIWFGTIPVNRGQRFDVTIGDGGTSGSPNGTQTIFGAYTSDAGQRYDPAYTDAISGLDLGVSNVLRPPWHSGDGGAKNVNGGSGTVILYWNLDPEWVEGEWFFAGDIYAGEAQA